LDSNHHSGERARYWNHLSEDLVLGGQEETKVSKKVYKRLRKESKWMKGNPSEQEPIASLNTPSAKMT
jgi:hypothetical protein